VVKTREFGINAIGPAAMFTTRKVLRSDGLRPRTITRKDALIGRDGVAGFPSRELGADLHAHSSVIYEFLRYAKNQAPIEVLKQLSSRVRCGRLFDVQTWLVAGKPFRTFRTARRRSSLSTQGRPQDTNGWNFVPKRDLTRYCHRTRDSSWNGTTLRQALCLPLSHHSAKHGVAFG
jgi:hypothetical protein